MFETAIAGAKVVSLPEIPLAFQTGIRVVTSAGQFSKDIESEPEQTVTFSTRRPTGIGVIGASEKADG